MKRTQMQRARRPPDGFGLDDARELSIGTIAVGPCYTKFASRFSASAVSVRLSVNQVLHDRFIPYVLAHTVHDGAVRKRQPVVLTKVFGPGIHDEGFDVPIRLLHVTEDPPTRGTVTTPDSPVRFHGVEKGIDLACADV